MRARTRTRAGVLALILLSGCVAAPLPQFAELDFPLPGGIGRLYTHVVEPLDVDYHDSRVEPHHPSRGDIKRVTYSNLSVLWGTNGIGELGQRAGFTEVLYADLEVFSILGIWTQTWVHVYGR